ncbi:MAG: c-type cytochrome [Acidobacteriaceae bacterium]
MARIIAKGQSAFWMHQFVKANGGFLTDQQADSIVNGMIEHWGQPGILNGANPPAYKAAGRGSVEAGKVAFGTFCARCHGADGTGAAGSGQGVVYGSIVDPTYLALASDRELRDIVVAGMAGEGMPDWRGDAEGKPMTDQQVTDVVAWLSSHRTQFPGQPFPTIPPVSSNFPRRGN